MRKEGKCYSPGDQRIVKRFLLFPLNLSCEVRWLETAYIGQTYDYGIYNGGFWSYDWWATEEDYEEHVKDNPKPRWKR